MSLQSPPLTQQASQPRRAKGLVWWCRQFHCYFGLAVSPFLIVFAISAILINHGWRPSGTSPTDRRQVAIQAPEGLKGLDLAKEILRQVNVSGEIDFFPADAAGPRVRIPVSSATKKVTVNADLSKGTADIEERPVSLAEGVIYLHKSPGPHNAAIRGNWPFTRLWSALADGTVYLLVLVTVTGIYLWLIVKSERKTGLVALAAGCITFALILMALMQ